MEYNYICYTPTTFSLFMVSSPFSLPLSKIYLRDCMRGEPEESKERETDQDGKWREKSFPLDFFNNTNH